MKCSQAIKSLSRFRIGERKRHRAAAGAALGAFDVAVDQVVDAEELRASIPDREQRRNYRAVGGNFDPPNEIAALDKIAMSWPLAVRSCVIDGELTAGRRPRPA